MKKLIHESIMPFGKYKGQTMQQILNHDPGYILWLDKKAEDVAISNCIYKEAVQAIQTHNAGKPDYINSGLDYWDICHD
jgi:hypothetical protein